MKYSIRYLEVVVKEHIPILPKTAKERIKKAIEDRLSVDPVKYGKPLQYSLKGHRRLRVGDYRVIYRIDSSNFFVLIVAIEHRKNVYQDF
jgi:mRNA interferase RelE/StbE